jgi:hypothetical protein
MSMNSTKAVLLLGLLLLSPSYSAIAQQVDANAMMMWGSAASVRYHIVGVYQARTNVIGDPNWIGYADVTDRVTIDLKWDLTESKMVGAPAIQNEKSEVKNLRNYDPKCLPPVLKGEYEHCELLAIKEGLGGALELEVRTSYPASQVVQFCTGPLKAIPPKVVTQPMEFVVPSPVMMGMPLPDSDALRLSADKKSLVVKKAGWTWTFTPSLEPKK